MGCCGEREKGVVSEEQKWDYITLSDFKSRNCIAPFSYIWLWVLVFISIAVYVADTFTAVNLIAFNRWSSQVQPAIPFEISKWIFFVTICLSWALCGLEWLRAIRVMRGGGVADSYLDPLAAVLQSIRLGKGQGWRRFLVFTELTRSKKGTDYIALFVYFQIKGAIRIIFAEGPRQVVNALTLYSVMKLKLIPTGENAAKDNRSPIEQFFTNVETLADSNHEQAVILSSMLFTLVVWVITALSLLIAVILYLFFLWHYIPSADGTLARYCRRKIDGRLDNIVSVKVKKALRKQEAKRRKEEQKTYGKAGEKLQQRPTLPSLGGSDDDTQSVLSLSTTLPPYSSQPPTRTNTMTTTSTQRQPTMPNITEPRRPFPPSRSATQSSNASYSSNAPLLGDASPMGYDEPGRRSPIPPLPPLDISDNYRGAPMGRPITPSSSSGGPARPFSPMSIQSNATGRSSPMGMRPNGYGPPGHRQNPSFGPDGRNSPGPMGSPGMMSRQNTYNTITARPGLGPSPLSTNTGFSPFDRRSPAPGPAYEMSPVEPSGVRPPLPIASNAMTSSPVSAIDDYDPYRPLSTEAPTPAPSQSYSPYGPATRNGATSPQGMPLNGGRVGPSPQPRPLPSAVLQSALQRREASNPMPARAGAASAPPQRSVTDPVGQQMYAQSQPPLPRSATAGPSGMNGQARG